MLSSWGNNGHNATKLTGDNQMAKQSSIPQQYFTATYKLAKSNVRFTFYRKVVEYKLQWHLSWKGHWA